MLDKNGMRQPNAKNCSSVSHSLRIKNNPPDRMNPIGAPSCGNIPYHARFPGGAFSIASNTAPPHSPPSPSPCPKRHKANNNGAITPAVAYVGNNPIATVEIPIVNNAATRVAFRPTRSPKCPNNADPTGRAKNAMANVANDSSIAADGSDFGKNNFGNTSTAAFA